jgi:hypothetical protein
MFFLNEGTGQVFKINQHEIYFLIHGVGAACDYAGNALILVFNEDESGSAFATRVSRSVNRYYVPITAG